MPSRPLLLQHIGDVIEEEVDGMDEDGTLNTLPTVALREELRARVEVRLGGLAEVNVHVHPKGSA